MTKLAGSDGQGRQPTAINYVQSRMQEHDLTAIYQAEKNFNLPVELESYEEFSTLMQSKTDKEIPEEDLKFAYGHAQAEFDIYKNRRWNLYDYEGTYDTGGGTEAEKGQLKWFDKDESWINTGPSNYANFLGLEQPVIIEHQDQIAEKNELYYDRNGILLPLEEYDKRSNTNKLQNEWDEKLNTWVYRELKDGELGDPAKIKPYEWVGGARELNSTWLGSASRGTISGAVGKTVQAGGGLLHVLNAVAAPALMVGTDRSYTEAVNASQLNDLANQWSNAASAMQRQNYDEAVGVFDNANSILYSFWDGVGQFLPMIASGFSLGAAGVGTKLATQMSISIGSLTVYDLTRNDLVRKGYSAQEAEAMGLMFGLITHGSENIISANLVQRFGVKQGQRIFNNLSRVSAAEVIEDVSGGMVKGLAEAEALEMPAKGFWANKYTGALRRNFHKMAAGKGLLKGAGKAVGAGVEEGFEEAAEGVGHMTFASLFNAIERNMAKNNLRKNGGATFDPLPGGDYAMKNSNGITIDRVNEKEKRKIERQIEFSKGILDGSRTLDESFSWEEPAIAFLSSTFTMGIAHNITAGQNRQGQQMMDLAMRAKDDPTVFDKIDGMVDSWVKMGHLEKNVGDDVKVGFRQDLEYYVAAINEHNLDNPELIKTLGGDKSFLFDLLQTKETTKSLKGILAIMDNEQLEPEAREQALNAEWDKIGVKRITDEKEIQAWIERNDAYEKMLTEKKTNVVDGVEVTTSQVFTEKMNGLYAVDVLISEKAKKNIEERYGDVVPVDAYQKEMKKIKNSTSQVILEALNDRKIYPVWEMLTKALKEWGPNGLQSVIDAHNSRAQESNLENLDLQSPLAEMARIEGETFDFEEVLEQPPKKGKAAAKVAKPLTVLRKELADMKARKKRGSKDEGLDAQIAEWEEEIRIQEEAGVSETAGREVATTIEEGEGKPAVLFPKKTGLGIVDAINEVIARGEYGRQMIKKGQRLNTEINKYIENAVKVFGNVKAMLYDETAVGVFTGALEQGKRAVEIMNLIYDNAVEVIEGKPVETGIGDDIVDEGDLAQRVADVEQFNTKRDAGILAKYEGTIDAMPEVVMQEHLREMLRNAPQTIKDLFEIDEDGRSQAFRDAKIGTYKLGLLLGMLNNKFTLSNGAETSIADIINDAQIVFGNPNLPIDNGAEWINKLDIADQLLDTITTMMELMVDVTQNHIEKLPSGQGNEHSIYHQDDNSKWRLDPFGEERQFIDEFVKRFKKVINDSWKMDKRLESASTERESVKVKLGNQSRMLHHMRSVAIDAGNDDIKHKLTKDDIATVTNKSRKISEIIKKTISKYKTTSDVENADNDHVYPEQLYPLYYNSIYTSDGKSPEKNSVKAAIALIDKELMDIEEIFSGKLGGFIEHVKKTSNNELPYISTEIADEPVYNMSSGTYDGLASVRKYDDGRVVWKSFSDYKKEGGKKSASEYIQEQKFRQEEYEYSLYTFSYFQFLSVANSLGNGKTNTRRQMLAQAEKLNLNNLTKANNDDLETFEQLDAIVDVVAFMQSQDKEDWNYPEGTREMLIDHTLFVRGYAGSGKSAMVAKNALLYYAALENKAIDVLYIIPTKGVEKIHSDAVEEINTRLSEIGSEATINPVFIPAHDLVNNEDLYKDADIIIYEEGSTIPAPDPVEENAKEEGNLLRSWQREHKKRVVILGDEGQVKSLNNSHALYPVDNFGEKTNALNQIFRTGIIYIRALQEGYRRALGVTTEQIDEAIGTTETKWKTSPDGNVGVRYIKRTEGLDQIVQNFLDQVEFAEANETGKTQMLLVPTYANMEQLIDKYGDRLGMHKDKIFTLEYDAKKIRQDSKRFKYNASGLKADQVFIPFDMASMLEGDAGLFALPESGGREGDAVAIMLTAVSRASQYVEMFGNPEISGKVTDNTPISGYSTTIETDEDVLARLTAQRMERAAYFEIVGTEEKEVTDEEEGTDKKKKKKKRKGKKKAKLDDLYKVDSQMYFGDGGYNIDDAEAAFKKTTETKTYPGFRHASDIAAQWLQDKQEKTESQILENKQLKERRAIFDVAFQRVIAKEDEVESIENLLDSLIRKYRPMNKEEKDADKENQGKGTARWNGRVNGFKRRMIAVAQEVAETMGYNEFSVHRPNIKPKDLDIQGSPYMIKTVGYDENGNPIVDIFTRTYTLHPRELNKYGQALAHTYRFIAEEKGWIVNNVYNVNIADSKSWIEIEKSDLPAEYFVDQVESTDVPIEDVAKAIGLKRTEFRIADPTVLFALKRKIDVAHLGDGVDIFTSDPIVEKETGEAYFVRDLLLDKNGLIANLENQVTGEIITVPQSYLTHNIWNPVEGTPELIRERSAIEYKTDRTIYVTHMLAPQSSPDFNEAEWKKKMGSGANMFNRKKNKWFDLKLKSLDAITKLPAKMSVLDKIYRVSAVYTVPNRSTRSYEGEIYNNVFEIRFTEEQLDFVAKEIGISKKQMKELGLDFVGIDTPAEARVPNNKDKKFSDNWLSKVPEFNKWLGMPFKDAKQAVYAYLEDSFAKSIKNQELLENTIDMNVAKFVQVHKAHNNQTPGTTGTKVTIEKNLLMPSRAQRMSFIGLLEQMQNDGFSLVQDLDDEGFITPLKYSRDKRGGRFNILISFKDPDGNIVDVIFDAAPMKRAPKSNESDIDVIKSFFTGATQELKKYDALVQEIEEMWNEDIEDNPEFKALTKRAQDGIVRESLISRWMDANSEMATSMIASDPNLERFFKTKEVTSKSGVTYKNIQVKGGTYKQRLLNLKAAVPHIIKAIENRYADQNGNLTATTKIAGRSRPLRFYYPVIVRDDDSKKVNVEYLTTNTIGVNQSVARSKSANIGPKPKDAKTGQEDIGQTSDNDNPFQTGFKKYGKKWVPGQTTYISKEAALQRIAQLIGSENAQKYLGFEDGLIIYKGTAHWGIVKNGLMKIAQISKGIEGTTPDHESLHFVIEYLMGDKQRISLINAAKKELPAGATYGDAHEYLAEKFEYENYRPTTYIGRVLLQIKKWLYSKFKLFSSDIQTILAQVDDGYFANNEYKIPSNPEAIIFPKVADIENEFNTDIVRKQKTFLFGSNENIDFWAERNIAPMIFSFYGIGKSVSAKEKFAGVHSFQSAVQKVYQTLMEYHDYYMSRREAGKVFRYFDGSEIIEGEEKPYVVYGEIPNSVYIAVSKTMRELKNKSLSIYKDVEQASYAENKKLIDAYIIQELTRPASKQATNPAGKTIFYNLVQTIFGNVDMTKTTKSGDPFFTLEGNIIADKEQESPSKNVSSFLTAMFNSTRLREYRLTANGVSDDFYGDDNYMDAYLMLDELFKASERLVSRGRDVNIDTILESIREKRDNIAPGKVRRNLHTFLVEFGGEIANSTKLNKQAPLEDTTNLATPMGTISGVGYYYLEKNLEAFIEDYFDKFDAPSSYTEQLIAKAYNFKKVSALIESATRGIMNMRRVKISRAGRYSNITEYGNEVATMIHGDLRDGIQNKFYQGRSGSVSQSVIDDFTGENPNIRIDGTGLYMNIDGQMRQLISLDTSKPVVGYEETESLNNYAKQVLQYITDDSSITADIAEAIILNQGKEFRIPNYARDIYVMYLALYSAVLNTQDFNETGDLQNEEIVWTKSEKTKAIDAQLEKIYKVYPNDFQLSDPAREDGIQLFSPVDAHRFIRNNIAYQMANVESQSRDKVQMMDDGTIKQSRETTTNLYEYFLTDGENGASDEYVNNMIQEAERIAQESSVEVPGVSMIRGKVTWRDPLMNRKVFIQPLGTNDSIAMGNRVIMANDMSAYEYIRSMFILTKDEFAKKKDVNWFPVFAEMIGDKGKIPFTKIKYGENPLFKGQLDRKRNLKILEIDEAQLVNILNDFVEHDHKQKELTLKNWKKATGLDENGTIPIWEDKVKNIKTRKAMDLEFALVKFRDYKKQGDNYVIGNGYSQEYSPYTKINLAQWRSMMAKGDVAGMMKVIESAFADRVLAFEKWLGDVFVGDSEAIIGEEASEMLSTKKFNSINKALSELSKIKGRKRTYDSLAKMVSGYKNNTIQRSDAIKIYQTIKAEYDIDIARLKSDKGKNDFNEKYYPHIAEIRDLLFSDNLNKSTDALNMAKVLFWNHHIFNKTLNQNIRGGVENFNDLSDYVKRGKGFDAIGKTFSRRYMGKKIRSLTTVDPVMFNKIFSETVEKTTRQDEKDYVLTAATDGLVPLNPVLLELMRRSKGYEMGPVTRSSQKTIYYGYKITEDKVKQLKMSMFAPQFDKMSDPFYLSMMKTFLGSEWTDEMLESEEKFEFHIHRLADEIYDELGRSDGEFSAAMNNMIGWINFDLAMKNGTEKVHYLQDGLFKPEWNNDKEVDILDADSLRLQLYTGNFVFDNQKQIPTQELYIIGVGEHNTERVAILNKALSNIAEDGAKFYEKLGTLASQYIRAKAAKNVSRTNESSKMAEIINDGEITLDVWRRKAVSTLASDSNKYLKPTLPGSALVQVPYREAIYATRKGKLYTEGNQPTDWKERGYIKRSLNPIKFWKKEGNTLVPYESREELLKDSTLGLKIYVTPQEVIMPFVHQHKFGISTGKSASKLFTIRTAKGYKNRRTDISQMIHNSSQREAEILTSFYEGWDTDKILNPENLDPDIIRYIKKKAPNVVDEGDRKKVIYQIAKYFSQLNHAMDVFTVRIPTTNASSGFPSRIVEFSYGYDNTIFTSPEKNILDGSDYDIDELHTFHKPLFQDLGGEEAIEDPETGEEVATDKQRLYEHRATIFNAMWDYYYQPKNVKAVLQRVTTETVSKLADQEAKADQYYPDDLYSAAMLRDRSIAGKKLVGHYANLQNALSKILHIPADLRFTLTTKGSVVRGKSERNPGVSFDDVLKLIGRVSEMINAATDNDSLGGALGKIGFTEYTSPLVSGMIYMGKTLEEIVAVTNHPDIRAMENSANKARLTGFVSRSIWKGDQGLAKKVEKAGTKEEKDQYEEWLQYAYIGEKLRRMNTIIGLQQGIDGNEWGLYNTINQVESALGQSVEDFIAGEDPDINSQINYIGQNKISDEELEKDRGAEAEIRSTATGFDLRGIIKATPQFIQYINVLANLKKVYGETFIIGFQSDFFKEVLETSGQRTLRNEKAFNSLMSELEHVAISQFLSTEVEIVRMGDQTYELSDPAARQQFVIDMQDYVKEIRAIGKYPLNSFISKLKKKASKGPIPIYNLSGSEGASMETLRDLKENGFQKLTDDDKQIFRIYNALVYGFTRKDGNMSGATDSEFEQQFTNWIEEADVNPFDSIDPRELYARAAYILNPFGKQFKSSSENLLPESVEVVDNQFFPLNVPYSPLINTYPGDPDIKTYNHIPVFRKLSMEELEQLGEKEVTLKIFKHGVSLRARDRNKSTAVNRIYKGDLVFLIDGGTARIVDADKNTVTIKRESKAKTHGTPNVTHMPDPTNAENISRQQAATLVSSMKSKVARLFPNLKVVEVSNSNTLIPGAASYIDKGIVYINRDMITPDTKPHEIRHLYLVFLRESNPGAYNRLRRAAISLLDNNDPFAKYVAVKHSFLENDAIVEEVIVAYMNIDSEEELIAEYEAMDIRNGRNQATGVWNAIKNFLRDAWKSILDVLKNAFGIAPSVDIAHNTIKEFAVKAQRAMNNNEVISQITSTDLNRLMYAMVTHKPNQIRTVKDLLRWIVSNGDLEEGTEQIERRELIYALNTINRFQGKVPDYYTGKKENFDLDGLTINSPAVKKFNKDMKNRSKKITNNIATALSDIGGYFSSSDKQEWLNRIFGKIDKKNVVQKSAFDKFLNEIGWVEGKVYVKLKDLEAELGLGNIVPAEFAEDNIIISIDYNNEEQNERVISIIDLEQTMTQKSNKDNGILEPLIGKNDQRLLGVSLSKNASDQSGIKMALIANHIMKADPSIKVREAGYARLWKNRKNFYSVNLTHMNTQILKMGKIPAFKGLLGNELKKSFSRKGVVDPTFNWAIYLKALWDEYQIKGRGNLPDAMKNINELTPYEKIKLYTERMRQLVDEYIEGGMKGSPQFWKEIDYLRGAITELKLPDISARQLNPYEEIGNIERYLYGVQNIGEENSILIQSLILQAEKKISREQDKQKKIMHKALDRWQEITGISTVSALNKSKKNYEKLFDTITQDGKTWRTGAIYWTDVVDDSMSEQEKALARRARDKNLTKEELEVGKMLVDQIEDLMVKSVLHYRNNIYSNYNYDVKNGKEFTYEDAKKELYENSAFYRGFIPMMDSTVDEKIARGRLYRATKKQITQMSDISTIFEESPNYAANFEDEKLVRQIQDRLFSQIAYGTYNAEAATEYGSLQRTEELLGLKLEADKEGNNIWILENADTNDNLSYDIENLMDYLILTTVRTPMYEIDVLPIINGVKLWLEHRREIRGEETLREIEEYIEMTTEQSVLGRKRNLNMKVAGVSVDKVLSTIDMVARPIVMAINPSVAVISGVANTTKTYIEAWSNKIANTPYFGPKEVNQAFLKLLNKNEFAKIMQIGMEYGVINRSEFDMAHFQKWKKLDKAILSDYWSNYLNWTVDSKSRLIAMVAQMIKEGSYDAHSINSDGDMVYTEAKDERWKGEGGATLKEAMRKKLQLDGEDVSGALPLGYDTESSNTFKALSDMYIVGEFDKKTASILSNYAFGQSILFLNRWLVSAWHNAFGKPGRFKQQGGVLTLEKDSQGNPLKDEEGNYIPKWERLSAEGYVNTFWKWALYQVSNMKNPDRVKWSQMDAWQKRNIAKFGITMSILGAANLIFLALRYIKVGDDDIPIADLRPMQPVKLAINSLLVLPQVIQLLTNPLAGTSILTRGFTTAYGDLDYRNLRNLIPGRKAYQWVDEPIDIITGESIAEHLFE